MEPKEGVNTGNAGKGRPKGAANKTTALLKEAIIRAAEEHGEDNRGTNGLTGYCRYLASTEPKAFATLLGKVLPMQVTGEDGGPIKITRIELVPLTDDDG